MAFIIGINIGIVVIRVVGGKVGPLAPVGEFKRFERGDPNQKRKAYRTRGGRHSQRRIAFGTQQLRDARFGNLPKQESFPPGLAIVLDRRGSMAFQSISGLAI